MLFSLISCLDLCLFPVLEVCGVDLKCYLYIYIWVFPMESTSCEYWRPYKLKVNFGPDNSLVPFGCKPLPIQVFTQL